MTTVVVLVVVLVVLLALGVWAVRRQRTQRLRQRFGDEYDRTLTRSGSRRTAEQALTDVAERRDRLDIRPLTPAQRALWADRWTQVQARFVDAPADAVATARSLVPGLMQERGYPTDEIGDDDRAALLATDHPLVVGEYRAAEAAYQRHVAGGGSSTEALRQALVHYRALFVALLGPGGAERTDGAIAVPSVPSVPSDQDGTGDPHPGRHAVAPDPSEVQR